jgi:hypothetical protein
MPVVWISLAEDKPEDHRMAVAAGVHRALVETFGVAENDRMQIMTRAGPGTFRYDRCFAGIERPTDLVLIQVTAANPGVDPFFPGTVMAVVRDGHTGRSRPARRLAAREAGRPPSVHP